MTALSSGSLSLISESDLLLPHTAAGPCVDGEAPVAAAAAAAASSYPRRTASFSGWGDGGPSFRACMRRPRSSVRPSSSLSQTSSSSVAVCAALTVASMVRVGMALLSKSGFSVRAIV